MEIKYQISVHSFPKLTRTILQTLGLSYLFMRMQKIIFQVSFSDNFLEKEGHSFQLNSRHCVVQ